MADTWLRPEYKEHEGELETRAEFEARTGISEQSLSSMFTRYADRVPAVVKTFGKKKYFVAKELDGFVQWIRENSGTRSEADVKRAEVARLVNSVEEATERVDTNRLRLTKAERELALRKRQLKRAKDDLAFLEQVEKDKE
jgi:hypothetical protein